MGCCGCCLGGDAESEQKKSFTKGGERDVSDGPLKNRGCTDPWCFLVWVAAMVAFIFVTVVGFADGNYQKLYRPRDWSGAFCGIEDNWNGGPNLQDAPTLAYFMNMTTTIDLLAKEVVCTTPGQQDLEALFSAGKMSQVEYDNMLCACCISQCSDCEGSLPVTEYSDPSTMATAMSEKMIALTSFDDPDNTLYNAGGPNGDLFNTMFEDAALYFVKTCTTACEFSNSSLTRSWIYEPAADSKVLYAWRLLRDDASVSAQVQDTIRNSFTFRALPYSKCPYDARYCIPVPGVEFEEIVGGTGYCTFKLVSEVAASIGDSVASALENTGVSGLTANVGEDIGTWYGDLEANLGAVVVVFVVAFVIGLAFLILLRFFIGCVVWGALCLIFVLLVIGGFASYVRSYQCSDASLLDSGISTVSNVAAFTEATVTDLTGQVSDSNYTARSESLSGNGTDYRGAQTRTKSFKKCQNWDDETPWVPLYNSTTYPDADLVNNYCRNPDGQAKTIWCYTTDTNTMWEICYPVSTIIPECEEGYAVESESGRKALEIIGYIIWGLAGLWVIAVCCMYSQVQLAIGVNKVAADFVVYNRAIILQPIIQYIIAVLWTLAWMAAASFLVSQVPDNHVPSEAFASYPDAYGDGGFGGRCTDNAPVGAVYKDELAASCMFNATTGATPECWKCMQPRHYIKFENWKFWVSLFAYLWNYAFVIASGQFIVAGAVAAWFFTPHKQKGKTKCIRQALHHLFRYHIGSILFGSFILAVVQLIRYMLKTLEKQAQAQNNKVMQYVYKCLQCCVWCFEQCIKFLNKNAYIQIALLGTNFCVSAKAAFFLIMRNAIRFAWVTILGSMTQTIGVVFITVATGVAGWFIWEAMAPEASPILAMTLFIVFGYVVGKLYLNIFALAVDTCLQCFIAVEEMGGEPAEEEAKYVPKVLRDKIAARAPKKQEESSS